MKDNILFGLDFDQEKLDKCIEAWCLEHDLEIFNSGVDTEIGERGINASGGQKARISLARAVYADADIYLLDDPLSAVDPDVAGKLYKRWIEGALKEKWVVLVTHQIQHLTQVPKIVLLEEGKIKMEGSYSELKEHGMDFEEILKGYEKDDKDEIFGEEEYEVEENSNKLIPIHNKSKENSLEESHEALNSKHYNQFLKFKII